MTRYLTVEQVKQLHTLILRQSGGRAGIRDEGALESAVAQPQMSFGGEDLYGTLSEKAAVLAFALVRNHAFVDGNKRVGHAALEVFLLLNGYELSASVEEQEGVFLSLAAGEVEREELARWIVSVQVEYRSGREEQSTRQS